MEFIDLATQQEKIRNKILERIQSVLRHGKYIMGPEIDDLEEKLAEFVKVNHCVTVASGTDALLLSLLALEIGPGDEIITSPFTFISTAETIAMTGAKPVFVDIEPHTYNINPEAIEKAITDRTKAIMPVSLYGQCADFDAINDIARKHNLKVIEDGAQSFGATYKNNQSCSLSDIGCTSFFPSKPLGCYGDGGACFTNDEEIATRLRQLRIHGQEKRYWHKFVGINGRMDTIQAAILLEKLNLFTNEIKLREGLGKRYSEHLKETVKVPYIQSHNTSVYAQYTIQVKNRDGLMKYLNQQGIPTAIHYPLPLHMQPAFSYLGHEVGSFPVSESAAKHVISLPMHPYLAKDDQDKVINAVNSYSEIKCENMTSS